MKVAIIHDSLNEFGGGEKVLSEFIYLFPQAEVFTSFYKSEFVKKYFPKLKLQNLHASWYQYLPYKTTTTLQFFSPIVWNFKKLKKFDLIITISGFYLCSITALKNSIPAIHYVISLPKNLFGLERASFWQKKLPFSHQKKLYTQSLKNSKHVIVDSHNVQEQLIKLGISSSIIYPPVSIPIVLPPKKKKEYYLIISRIDITKGLELAIKACNHLGLRLKIAGDGVDSNYLKKLKKMAKKNIEFLGFVSEKEKRELYQKAIAFLFCSKNEDFGIAPVEAIAHGVPVIAYWGGGIRETMIKEKTGVFFYRHSWQSMVEAIKKFSQMKFDRRLLFNRAKKFSQEQFRKKIIAYIKNNFPNLKFDS